VFEEKPAKPSYYTLNMRHDRNFVRHGLDWVLRRVQYPYLTFVIRSDIGTDAKLMKNMQDNFNTVMTHRLTKRFVFSTPAEAMMILGLEESTQYQGGRTRSAT
jgi:hypothetical protein